MNKTLHKIHFDKEKETLLITLHAKALDFASKNSILHDKKADEILRVIDYDFGKFNGPDNDNLTVIRAKQFDDWLNEFLKKNKNAVVLNLGCGLDTRVSRVRPQKGVMWLDVDYPEVITLRKNFYKDSNNYKMIASSVTNSAWLKQIPTHRPTIVIAEGLLEYLTEDEVKTLLNRLTSSVSHGQIAFDVLNSFVIKAGKSKLKETTGAEHTWAVDNPGDVDKLDKKMKRITDLLLLQSKYINQLSWKFRLMYKIMGFTPPFRTMMRLLRYQF